MGVCSSCKEDGNAPVEEIFFPPCVTEGGDDLVTQASLPNAVRNVDHLVCKPAAINAESVFAKVAQDYFKDQQKKLSEDAQRKNEGDAATKERICADEALRKCPADDAQTKPSCDAQQTMLREETERLMNEVSKEVRRSEEYFEEQQKKVSNGAQQKSKGDGTTGESAQKEVDLDEMIEGQNREASVEVGRSGDDEQELPVRELTLHSDEGSIWTSEDQVHFTKSYSNKPKES